MTELLTVDHAEWRHETSRARQFFAHFKDRLPPFITQHLDQLDSRIAK